MISERETQSSSAARVKAFRDKAKAPITLFRPVGLNLRDLSVNLTGKENSHALVEKALLVYTYLITRGFNTGKNTQFGLEWTQVHSSYWEALAGREYTLLRDAMLRGGLLEMRTVNEYTGEVIAKGTYKVAADGKNGGVAKQYRIPVKLMPGEDYFEVVQQPAGKALLNRVANLRKPVTTVAPDAQREYVAEQMRRLVLLDTPASRQAISTLWTENGLPADADAFLRIFNSNPFKKVVVDNFGFRVHGDAVSLKKTLFPFLRFADDLDSELEEIDFVNSQPSIFAVITPELIRQLVPECGEAILYLEAAQASENFQRYRELCVGGQVYEHLMNAWNAAYPEARIDRDAAKEVYYIAAFGNYAYLRQLSVERLVERLQRITLQELTTPDGRERKATLEQQLHSARAFTLFKREFPALVTLFEQLKAQSWAFNPSKEGDHTNNCLLAQRFESALVYGHLVKALLVGGISDVWTRHDALVVKKADAQRARALVAATLAKLKLPLKLKSKTSPVPSTPVTQQLAAQAAATMNQQPTVPTTPQEFFQLLNPKRFRAPQPQVKGTITVYHSAEDLPDHWKQQLAAGQPQEARQKAIAAADFINDWL